jgi:hypothetical protein
MQSTRWMGRHWFGLTLVAVLSHAQAGQMPGMASPWNGPWGGGFLNGESYSPLANPYIGAGYPVAAPYGPAGPGGGYPGQAVPQMAAQPRHLPGGGFLLPPAAGGGMLPGAYANH